MILRSIKLGEMLALCAECNRRDAFRFMMADGVLSGSHRSTARGVVQSGCAKGRQKAHGF